MSFLFNFYRIKFVALKCSVEAFSVHMKNTASKPGNCRPITIYVQAQATEESFDSRKLIM